MTEKIEFIKIDGVNLEFYRIGDISRSVPVLLFFHQGLGSAGLWRGFPRLLARQTDLPAIVFSRKGYGRSDPVEWPRPHEYLQNEGLYVAPKLVEQLGIEKVICIGHSEGASIALVFAAEFPQLVTALALESTHVYTEPKNVEGILAIKKEFEQGDLRERLGRHHFDNIDCAFYGWSESWLQPGHDKWSIEDYVRGVRCPVLALFGKDDEYITAEHFAHFINLIESPIEAATLDCGHSPHEELEDEVLQRFAVFIKNQTG